MSIHPTDQDVNVSYNDPAVSYLPQLYWKDSVSGGKTGIKISYNVSAYLVFNFTGSHIWYFGDFNPDHGNCSFAIDDNPPTVFSTYFQYFLNVQVLWDQGVTPGPHVLTITNLEDRKPVTVASFIYRPLTTATASGGTPAQTGSSPLGSPAAPANSTAGGQSKPPLPTGAIAGLAVGLAALLCSVVLLVVLLRRRHRHGSSGSPAMNYVDGTVTNYQLPSNTYQSLAHSPLSHAPPTYGDSVEYTQGAHSSVIAAPMEDISPMPHAALVKSSPVLQRDAKGGR
ncbi:hypothetical protein EXIGLDRAFT_845719 [Exidia glandulosa HHB12029]|uniref:Uncharacterized protein n=1 Tax=Exidia glandulosa HHB12029 TaxID=1314781 RepID=A0A165BBC7_EXIGL|nr:hypothetical protein EXIGLDRAFT_845719 [Exidia glandulosa HHB12029]